MFVIAEHDFRVKHCLMALPGTRKDQLNKVISHPQALAQCDSYIRKLGVKSEPAYDTAGSAKLIAEGKLEGVAAICSELAAGYYGLEVLDRNIEDDSNNFTRFLLLRHAHIQCHTFKTSCFPKFKQTPDSEIRMDDEKSMFPPIPKFVCFVR